MLDIGDERIYAEGYMLEDKIQLLKKTLEKAEGKDRMFCLIQLGEELRHRNPTEAKIFLTEALRSAGALGDLEVAARAARGLAEICMDFGEVEDGRNYATQVLEMARRIGHRRLEGAGFYLLGSAFYAVSEYPEAVQCYQQALNIWEEIGYNDGVCAVLNQLGNLSGMRGKFDEALRYYQRCVELPAEEGVSEPIAYCNLGWAFAQLGNWEDAIGNFYRAIALAEKSGYEYIRWSAMNMLGELFLKRNRLERAIELFSAVVDAGRKGRTASELLRDGLTNLGEAYYRHHNLAAAAKVYEEAIDRCKKTEDRMGLVEAYWRMAELELARGEMERCQGLCTRARELARELELRKSEAEALRVEGLLEMEKGMTAAASDCFKRALTILADAPESYEFARVQFQYGRLLLKEGNQEQGELFLKRAAQIFRNLSVVAEADEINRLLFQLELGTDRDMAVLSAISGLATLGLEPVRLLEESMRRMCEGWSCVGGALVMGESVRLVVGKVDLAKVKTVAIPGGKPAVTDSGIYFSVISGGQILGGIYLESTKTTVFKVNPFTLETIAAILAPAVHRLAAAEVVFQPVTTTIPGLRFSGVIGRSKTMQENLAIVSRVANSSVSVLIRGESGTGKELVARALHYSSPRRDKPFVAVNCSAVPETLLEAEFFGVEKGAATGVVARKGKFEIANGGTVFLDEIGDMSAGLQAKLLRVLQEKEIERVGGTKPIKLDVRIVTATHQNIEQLIKENKFRQDLFYRLNGVEIIMPPLRERKEDIPELVNYFISRVNQETNRHVKGVEEEVMQCFFAYDWPGNIRQLQNVIQRAAVLAGGEMISIKDLPVELQEIAKKRAGEGEMDLRKRRRDAQTRAVAEVERLTLLRVLEETGGDVTKAARLAGYSRAQFYRLLKKHNISRKK